MNNNIIDFLENNNTDNIVKALKANNMLDISDHKGGMYVPMPYQNNNFQRWDPYGWQNTRINNMDYNYAISFFVKQLIKLTDEIDKLQKEIEELS